MTEYDRVECVNPASSPIYHFQREDEIAGETSRLDGTSAISFEKFLFYLVDSSIGVSWCVFPYQPWRKSPEFELINMVKSEEILLCILAHFLCHPPIASGSGVVFNTRRSKRDIALFILQELKVGMIERKLETLCLTTSGSQGHHMCRMMTLSCTQP